MPLLSWQWPISGKGLYNPLPLAVVFSRYRSFSDVITISQAAVLLFSSLTMVEASLSIAHPYSIYALLMARPCHSNNETFINRKTFTCDPALQFYHSPPTLSRRQRTSPSPQFHVPQSTCIYKRLPVLRLLLGNSLLLKVYLSIFSREKAILVLSPLFTTTY